MEMFNRGWRFALGVVSAVLCLALSAAVLSCGNASQSGEEFVIPENEVTGIEVTANRTVYGLNEVIDLTTLEVTATYDGGTGLYSITAAHLSFATATGAANASVPITVTVNGHTADFNIAVFPVVSLNAGTYTGYDTVNGAISAVDSGAVITLYANQTIANDTNPSGKTITLKGYGSERKITHSEAGAMFALSDTGTTLILADKITLDGNKTPNGNPLVMVNSDTALVMNDGAAITGGESDSYFGGVAVCVDGGTFTMSGGTISGNEADNGGGGGVCVWGGTFIMSGGAISGNKANIGGGVSVSVGSFIMSGGTISSNEGVLGGGVFVGAGGTFTMSGGDISSNTAVRDYGGVGAGGGVFVSNSKFTYNAGTFTGNTAEDYGAAVYKNSSAMINGDGGVEAGGSDIPYDVFPPES